MLNMIALCLSLAAAFSFINERYMHLQMTIGLLLLAFVFANIVNFFEYAGINLHHSTLIHLIEHIDFSQVVLQGMLCFLLFAGSKNVSLTKLKEYKWDVITLAIVATVIATFVIGSLTFIFLNALGVKITFLYSLIFGAIISPTDPIAALAILKSIGLPSSLEVIIDGESQFNDGIGVVLFVTISSIIMGESSPHASEILSMFFREVFGGIVVGLLMGFLTHLLVTNSKNITTQLLVTLSAVSVGYTLALNFDVSGPIASVVLGLIVGNLTMPKVEPLISREHISTFWEMVNQVLNAVLFVLIGLVALQIHVLTLSVFICILLTILIVLIGRYISVYLSMLALDIQRKFKIYSLFKFANLFTWTGLRGALAIALVLSMPNSEIKNVLIPMVYGVVLFTILVQGSTIKLFFSSKMLDDLVTPDKLD